MSWFADHFSDLAPAYARSRPRYPEQLFAYLSSACSRHELAWDCAAGTGQATIALARHFRRVIATDASQAMLSHAPAHPNVEYQVASAEASGVEAGTADLVTVAQALHWLNVEEFYREADRVLAPGGVLAVWAYGPPTTDAATVSRLLQHFYGNVLGPYWAPERRHVDSGYQTLPFPYREVEPPTFTMEEQWTLADLLGYLGTWSATQSFRRARQRDPLEDFARHLMPEWGDPALVRPIRWPLSLRLGLKPT